DLHPVAGPGPQPGLAFALLLAQGVGPALVLLQGGGACSTRSSYFFLNSTFFTRPNEIENPAIRLPRSRRNVMARLSSGVRTRGVNSSRTVGSRRSQRRLPTRNHGRFSLTAIRYVAESSSL